MTAHHDQPARTLGVRAEVWPVAADEASLWLVDADGPWRSDLIDAGSAPHPAVQSVLSQCGLRPELLHSTSWRHDDDAVVLTYLAVLDPVGPMGSRPLAHRPGHQPGMGRRRRQAATRRRRRARAAPRLVNVLAHGLRHLRFLADTDADQAAALPKAWLWHLTQIEPALFVSDTLHSDTRGRAM